LNFWHGLAHLDSVTAFVSLRLACNSEDRTLRSGPPEDAIGEGVGNLDARAASPSPFVTGSVNW
jgi:hypothetical protein